ncbi:uncharacterized protein [Antedon mediterranea]|uniref:uncharacterized protein n=1 Tax=Antedon mediterranea TaxID=105859 RepID=UPI003AF94771
MAEEETTHIEVIYQGFLKKGTPLDENGKAKKSFLKRSPGWKDKFCVLYLKEEEQRTYAFFAFHEKKPQNIKDEPKGFLKLWPHYRVDKKFDPKGKQHVFDIKTPIDTYRLMAETQPTMDLWVFYLQIQTKLRPDFPGDTFEVIPADSEEMRRIGAKSSKCLVNISKWGITLALKKTKSVVSQWPLKCVRGFESSDDGKFKFDAGRNSPMGQGSYMFKTQPEQDNRMFDLMDEYTTAAAQAEKIASPQGGPPQPPSDEEVATQYQSLRLATFGLLPQRKISGPGMATSCITIPGAQNQRIKYDRLQRKQSYGTENDVPVLSRKNSGRGISAHSNFNGTVVGTPPPLPPPRDGSLPHDDIAMPSDAVRPKDFPRRLANEPVHMYELEPDEFTSLQKDYPDTSKRPLSENMADMNHYQTPPPVHYMSPRNSILSHRSSITSDTSSVGPDRRNSNPLHGAVGGHMAYTTMGIPRSASSSSMKAYEAMTNAKHAAIVQQVSTPSPYENALTGSYENAPLISPGFYFSPGHTHSNQGYLVSPLSPQFIGLVPGMVPGMVQGMVPLAIPKEVKEEPEGAVGGVAEPEDAQPPKSLSETQFTMFSKEREQLHRQPSVPYASVNRDKISDAELGYIDMKRSIEINTKSIKKSPSLDALLDTISTSSLQDESPLIGSLDLAKSISPGTSLSKPSWFGSRQLPLPPEAYTEMNNVKTELLPEEYTEISNVKTVLPEEYTEIGNVKTEAYTEMNNAKTVLPESYTEMANAKAVLREAYAKMTNAKTILPEAYTEVNKAKTVLPEAYTEMNTVKTVYSKVKGKTKSAKSRVQSAAYEDIVSNVDPSTIPRAYEDTILSQNPTPKASSTAPSTAYEDIENLKLTADDETGYIYADVKRTSPAKKIIDREKIKRSLSNPNILNGISQEEYSEVLDTSASKTNTKRSPKTSDKLTRLKKSLSNPNLLGHFTDFTKVQKTNFACAVKPASHFSSPNPIKKKNDKKPEKKPKPKKFASAEKNTSSSKGPVEIAAGISTSSKTKSFSKHGRSMQRSLSLTSTGESQAVLSNRPLPGTPDKEQDVSNAVQTRPLPHLPGNTIAANDPDWV